MSARAPVIAALACLAAVAAGAKTGTPGPAYFEGSYDLIGRSGSGGGAQAVLLDGAAQIVAQGAGVVIRHCAGAAAMPDVALTFGPAYEVVNLMSGQQAGARVDCLFHNNGYNRPILTCRAASGAAFTLWPRARTAPACASLPAPP
jgi:hypothetical protein